MDSWAIRNGMEEEKELKRETEDEEEQEYEAEMEEEEEEEEEQGRHCPRDFKGKGKEKLKRDYSGNINRNVDEDDTEANSVGITEPAITSMLEMTIAGGIAKKDFQYLKDFLENFNVYPLHGGNIQYDNIVMSSEEPRVAGTRVPVERGDNIRITCEIAKRHQKRSKQQREETKARWEYQRQMQVGCDSEVFIITFCDRLIIF